MKGKEFLSQLADELESGKYKQAIGALVEVDESGEVCYCVQGVALKTIGLDEVPGRRWFVSPEGRNIGGSGCVYLDNHTGVDRKFWTKLLRLNDGGASFSQLAEFIREQM